MNNLSSQKQLVIKERNLNILTMGVGLDMFIGTLRTKRSVDFLKLFANQKNMSPFIRNERQTSSKQYKADLCRVLRYQIIRKLYH